MQAASQAAQASTACKDLTLTSGKTLAVALAVIGYAQTLWLATQHDVWQTPTFECKGEQEEDFFRNSNRSRGGPQHRAKEKKFNFMLNG